MKVLAFSLLIGLAFIGGHVLTGWLRLYLYRRSKAGERSL